MPTSTVYQLKSSPAVGARFDLLVPQYGVPDLLVVARFSLGSVLITWSLSNRDTPPAIIRRSQDQFTWEVVAALDIGFSNYIDSGLADGDYFYQVGFGRQVIAVSDWQQSPAITVYNALAIPGNFAAVNGASGVNLSWTEGEPVDLVTNFEIQRSPANLNTWVTIIITDPPGLDRSATDTSAVSGTSYDYRMRAMGTGIQSDYCAKINITASGGVTQPPTNFAAAAASTSSINLTWNPSPTSGATTIIERSPNGSSGWSVITTQATGVASYTDTGLSFNTVYFYRAKAHTVNGGDSTYTSVSSAKTQGGTGRTLVQFPGDYTYVGSCRVSGIAGFDARYASGLAFRYNAADVGNEKHLIMISQVNSFAVCEFRIPADASLSMGGANPLNPNNYPAVTGVKNYGTTPHFDSSGRYLGPNGLLGGWIGIFWDYVNDQLVTLGSRGYFNDGHFIFSTLDYASATGLCVGGRWYFDNPQYKSTSNSGCIAPQAYADTYLGGARLCYGTGGNQSVIAVGDVSMGFSLTASNFSQVTFPGDNLQVTDMACAGGTAVVTSPSNSFPAGLAVGHQVRTFFPGDSGTQLHTVASVQSTGQITLNSAPSATAKTGGTCAGTGTIVTDKYRLVGYSPTVGSPGAGHGRMTRPAGFDRIILADRYKVYADTWPANTYYYTDNTPAVVWVDSTDRYGVIAFSCFSQRLTFYLNASIYSSYFGHTIAVYDPYKFAPASGSQPYDIQPDTHAFVQFPGLDYTTYVANATNPPNIALQPFVTVTSIASDASKKGSNNTGCLVTAPGHGLTGASVPVEVYGSTDEFNSLWFFNVIDADHGYIFNPQNSTLWSGATDTQAGITIAKIGSQMTNSSAHGNLIGAVEDPTTHYVYVAINNGWAVNNASGAPLIRVYKPNFS